MITFQKFGPSPDFEACLARIRCRVGELNALMPMLQKQPAIPEKEKKELTELRITVKKEFQRMVALLDQAMKGKAPAEFSEWDAKLDAVDAALLTALNRAEAIVSGGESGSGS